MAIELNHTIIRAKDKWELARFLAHILGVEAGPQWARFVPVKVGGVTLDFADAPDPGHQHFAFLVSEDEFDAAFGASVPPASTITPTTTVAEKTKSIIITTAAASISIRPTATCSR